MRSLAKPGNIIDNKVDLSSIADQKTENIATWIIEKGNVTISDAMQNPSVQRSIYDIASGILSNPRAITSVLTDNTDNGYDFYYDDKDLMSKIKNRVEKENEYRYQTGKKELSGNDLNDFVNSQKEKFILLTQDDQGVYQPNLTNNQIEDARTVTLDALKSRLARKVEQDEPVRYSGGGGGGLKKSTEDNSAMIAGYKATIRAWGGDPEATIASGNFVASGKGPDFGGLKQGYIYKPKKGGGIEVYKGRDLVFTANSPKDLSQFVYNGEPAEASLKWEDARKMAMSSQSGNQPQKGGSGIQW